MIVVCGEALIDMKPSPLSKKDGPLIYHARPGGSPLNVAIGLARLGRTVSLSTQLFTDEFGRRLASGLRYEGVDTSLARREMGATPLALISTDAAGLPQYVFHGLRDLKVYPDQSLLEDSRAVAVHVGSVPIVCRASSRQLLSLVSSITGRLISFDPNVRLSFEPSADLWRRKIDEFRRNSHLIKVSADDIRAIYGSDTDPERVAASWVEHRTVMVALTNGEKGAIIFTHQGEKVPIPAAASEVADTVGAGDSFMAALLCWLDERGLMNSELAGSLSNQRVRSMGVFASLAAARTCSRHGADLPYRSQLPDL